MKYYYSFENIYLEIEYFENKILSIRFVNKKIKNRNNEFAKIIKREFDNYFLKISKNINLKYTIKGSDFQKNVLKQIIKIPYGKTASYKQIAEKCGNKKAYRAVGNVCAKNNLVLLIPCHRVVSSNGIGGFSYNIDIKKWLLKHEKSLII